MKQKKEEREKEKAESGPGWYYVLDPVKAKKEAKEIADEGPPVPGRMLGSSSAAGAALSVRRPMGNRSGSACCFLLFRNPTSGVQMSQLLHALSRILPGLGWQ